MTVLLVASAWTAPAQGQQEAHGFALERFYASAPGGGAGGAACAAKQRKKEQGRKRNHERFTNLHELEMRTGLALEPRINTEERRLL